jgi:hypothetical protein
MTAWLKAMLVPSVAMLTSGCAAGAGDAERDGTSAPSVVVIPLSTRDSLATVSGVTVRSGGFGSAASRRADGTFYFLSDRGPNYDFGDETKAFPTPEYGPHVGVFERQEAELTLVRRIPLRDEDGRPISGLPNPPGPGSTGEGSVTPGGDRIDPDPGGLDPEGLHVLADGTFWISEEYGPSLVQFDPSGRQIRRISPATPPGRALPKVLLRRRPNYGFEGLTGDPAGEKLVAILQSPLDNPRPSGRTSVHARIMEVEVATGKTRQFLYRLDAPDFLATDIAWIDPNRFLVLERDVHFKGGDPAATQKKVFLIDLSGATDVNDPADGAAGLTFGGKTVEELRSVELEAAGVRSVAKTLVLDLLSLGYPHDKPEGVVILGRQEIGVINDDDFAITDQNDRAAVKRLPATGQPDSNLLWVIRLPNPIW